MVRRLTGAAPIFRPQHFDGPTPHPGVQPTTRVTARRKGRPMSTAAFLVQPRETADSERIGSRDATWFWVHFRRGAQWLTGPVHVHRLEIMAMVIRAHVVEVVHCFLKMITTVFQISELNVILSNSSLDVIST